jgi:hypothetical protein
VQSFAHGSLKRIVFFEKHALYVVRDFNAIGPEACAFLKNPRCIACHHNFKNVREARGSEEMRVPGYSCRRGSKTKS